MAKLSVERTLRKAISHERNGQMDEARKCYDSILELFPGNIRAKQGLAKLSQPKSDTLAGENPSDEILHQLIALYNKGQIRTVIQECDRLTKEFPQSFLLWNLLGAAFKAQGKFEEAIAAFNKALLIKPDHSDAHYNRGLTLQAQGEFEEAVAAYNKTLLIKPDYADAHNNMGVVFQSQGKPEEAIAAYNKALLIKPDYVEAHNNMGNALTDQGKPEEAIAAFNKALLIKPDHSDAHYNRGLTLQAQGKPEEAITAYNKALLIKPDYVEAHNNRGAAFQSQGKPEEAIAAYNKALLIKPDYVEAHNNMGNALTDQGKLEEAIAAFNKALLIKPEYAKAHNNMGNALTDQGKLEEAIAAYNKALLIKPDYVEAHNNRGAAFQSQGKPEEAIAAYNKALLIKPDYVEAHNNMGNALTDQGKIEEAIAAYNKALLIKPEYAEAHNNLGNTLQELGRSKDAEASYRQAIALKADYAEAHSNLGATLKELGRLKDAEASCRKAIALKPDYAEAHYNHSNALKDLGQLDEALQNYDKAIQLKPDYEEAYSNLLMTLNYSPRHNHIDHITMARRFGELVTEKAKPQFSDYQCLPRPERLRVGLVSGDLRSHPVSYFLESVLSSMDQSKIELIAYPTTPTVDDLSERIKPSFSMWKPIYGKNDEAAANMIYADGVHILLDLSGHTANNRLPMFGYKPSPVQVSWLGYFATTGLNEMDYLLGDPHVTPPKDDDHFTEKVWRLPETRWCFTPPNADVEVSAPPAVKHGYVTFGCFNNITKINEKVVELWAKVLGAIPNSRLLLKAKQFRDQMVRESIIQQFAALGINSKRISLEKPEDRQKYFAAYNKIDITLDPFPFTGGTTSVESLWMGVPLVTLAGGSLISRQGVGVLMNAGLSDWVAADEEEYVAKAVLFASDLDKLASLRAGLRSQVLASPLFDAPRFARNIENALLEMWNQRDRQR